MIEHRSNSMNRSGWMLAAIFNIAIVFIPFMTANLLVSGFNGVPHNGVASAETLADTRREIDKAFEQLSDNGADARAQWAGLISQKLVERNMSAARGFLLAAPQMLSPSDQRAIRVAADAEPSGTEDQRLLRAALLFVPSDIRVRYEASLRPRGIELLTVEEEIDTSIEVASLAQTGGSLLSLASMTHTPAFSVLGTVEDLVSRSRDWMRGNRQNAFEMRLTGIAMASPPSATGMSSEDLMQAASILKTAWRSNRLQPQYARLLSQHLETALPDAALTLNLEEALSDIATLDVRARRVQDAFAKSIDPNATARLGPEFQQIAQMANATSPRGTLSLLEHVGNKTDISRARLLAQAGGDRAVALVSQIGPDALLISSVSIKWNTRTILFAIGLALISLFLLLSWFHMMQMAIFGHRKQAIL